MPAIKGILHRSLLTAAAIAAPAATHAQDHASADIVAADSGEKEASPIIVTGARPSSALPQVYPNGIAAASIMDA